MAKDYDFTWQVQVPECLREGAHFDRWDEDLGIIESHCLFKVDEYGFYIFSMSEGKDAQVLDLTQVSEIKPGGLPKDPKLLFDMEQRGSRETLEDRSLTLVSGLDYVNLNYTHLVAQDVQTATAWRESLQKVLHNFRVYHVCPKTCLQKHWTMLCLSVNDRKKIPVRCITRTFASGKTEKIVMQCLVDLGLCSGKKDEIEPADFTFEKFYELYLKICPRTDVQELFSQITNGAECLTVDQFVNFLNEKQRDPRLNEILFPFFDKNRVLQLIKKIERNEENVKKDRLGFDGFLRFLMSDDNAPVFLDRIQVYQDMDQPLCHYFINSSHNTYLIGRQFGGRSSVEIYRQVLLSGCRCVELDCWDGTGEDRGEPIITHGKAMCTDVLFKDVITAIRDSAFVTSEYPVILSFENHCSKNNQLKMARYCMDILGDLLLSRQLDSHPLEPGIPLPSPFLLRRKILIKNKRLKPEEERRQLEQFLKEGRIEEDVEEAENPEIVVGDDAESHDDDDDDTNDDTTSPMNRSMSDSLSGSGKSKNISLPLADSCAPFTSVETELAHPELKAEASSFKSKLKSFATTKAAIKEQQQQQLVQQPPNFSNEEEEKLLENALEAYHYTGATTKIHPLLSSLVNYTHPVRFQAFDISEQTNCHFHMSSFSESTGLGYLKTSALEFVNYSKRQLGRIYPKGGRVDSSNFLPQIFWNAGVQLVALNFQTPDLAMQLNQGRFEYNGSCGYLLKPDFMRRPDRMFDPFSESPVDGVIAAYCSIRIISGQFLSDKKIGTYVEVEMYGLPTDTIRKEFRTRIVPSNGLNPVFNEEAFVFRKVVLPELAVFRIAVYDENNKLLGQRILPLDGLQAGYRHISLRTETSLPMTLPTIFCHIVLKTYIPEGLADLVDALFDPKSDLEKKRQNQLRNMGVEEIEDVPKRNRTGATRSSANLLASTTNMNSIQAQPSAYGNSTQKDDKDKSQSMASQSFQLTDAVNVDDLRKDKIYLKMLKKHQKEREDLKKRHLKERAHMQKQQCNYIEKLLSDHRKKQQTNRRRSSSNLLTASSGGASSTLSDGHHSALTFTNSYNPNNGKAALCASLSSTPREQKLKELTDSHDAKVQLVVSQQTHDWSTLNKRQLEEEYAANRNHRREEWDLLKKLLDEAHQKQMAGLKQKLEDENKQLKQQQTKKSMEDSKNIQSDKTIKTKAEKDRRVKEVQDKNLKGFVEERKRLVVKHQRIQDQLIHTQVEQKESLEKEARKAMELEDQLHVEALLADKPQTLV